MKTVTLIGYLIATLLFAFSSGVDWAIIVIHYEKNRIPLFISHVVACILLVACIVIFFNQ